MAQRAKNSMAGKEIRKYIKLSKWVTEIHSSDYSIEDRRKL
jgi:hypothetical protein